MARGPCTFRQRDVTAALKAAIAAGCGFVRVKICREGSIVLEASKADMPQATELQDTNEWDEVK